ncbi:MAG: Uncharacterised protein [Owenweeksia sp. TMED14]|nr:MAG: Uncharacterised protein [Owenweeksia sp. TMED14]
MKLLLKALFVFVYFSTVVVAQSSILEGELINAEKDSIKSKYLITVQGDDWRAISYSDEDYKFRFTNLPTGLCNLTITKHGDQSSMVLHELYLSPIKPLQLIIPFETSFFLDEAVVIAEAFKTTTETPLSIKNINWTEMQRMPGATLDLSKSIQSFPGVLPKSSFGYNISIRGGSSSENIYRMDGIDIPAINHFSIQGASGGAVSLINMDFIQGVELYSGAFPSSMSNVLSGALNIELRNARTDRAGIRVTLGATDYGATLELPIGKRANLMISGRNSFSQHYFKLFSIPVLPTYQDAQMRFHYRISKKRDLTIIGLGGWDKYELFIKPNNRSSDALLYNVGYIPEGDQTTKVLGARYRHFVKNGLEKFVVSIDKITNNADKFIGNNRDNPNDRQLEYRASEQKTRMRYERLWEVSDGKSFILGVSGETFQWSVDSWSIKGSFTGVDTLSLINNSSIIQAGAFATYNQNVLKNKGSLSLGIRIDLSNFNLNMVNPLRQIAPRASFKYQLSPKWASNTHFGRYTKLPPAIILAANRSQNQSPSSDFTLADHFGTGVEYQSGKTYRVSMEVYSKSYSRAPFLERDKIAFANAIGTYVAVGDQASSSTAVGRAYGFELFLQQKLKKNYWWMAAYNYGKSEYKTANSSWKPSVWDSRHTASVTTGKVWGKGWQVGAKWRFSSGTPYTPFDVSSSSLTTNWDILQRGIFDYTVDKKYLDKYRQLDIRLDKTYANKGSSLSWFLDLSNIAKNKIPQMPYLTVVRDPDSKNPIEDPNDPSRYQTEFIPSDTGRILPTIGLILEF